MRTFFRFLVAALAIAAVAPLGFEILQPSGDPLLATMVSLVFAFVARLSVAYYFLRLSKGAAGATPLSVPSAIRILLGTIFLLVGLFVVQAFFAITAEGHLVLERELTVLLILGAPCTV